MSPPVFRMQAKMGPCLGALLLVVGVGCTPEEEEVPIPGEVPAPYAGMENPLAGDADAIAAGEVLWTASCTVCHEAGLTHEDGEAPGVDYYYWRIAEGGGFPPFDSEMPSFKDELSEDEIWQLVSYLDNQAHLHDH